jgi:uncharacterized protein YkwD
VTTSLARTTRTCVTLAVALLAAIATASTVLVAPAAAVPAAPTATISPLEVAMVTRINADRRAHGLPIVRVDRRLQGAADWMAGDLQARNLLDHVDSHGRSPATRIAAFGYPAGVATGETIASGRLTALPTFNDWIASPVHRAILRDRRWNGIGVGRSCRVIGGFNKCFWVADFGVRFGVPTPVV